MTSCPMPYFPMYAQELLADGDFSVWTPAERGCWLTLSARCWVDGFIPSDLEILGRLCGETDAKAMLKYWTSIASKFLPHPTLPDKFISPRIEHERDLSVKRAEKLSARGKAGATQRWKDKNDMLEHSLSISQAMLINAPQTHPQSNNNNPLPPSGFSDVEVVVPAKTIGHKPKGRDFGIGELDLPDSMVQAFNRAWKGWPTKGWNFDTKSEAPRRIQKELALKRFEEIIRFNHITKADGSRLTEEELAEATLAWVKIRIREAGGGIPNVPCIANFFSSVQGQKNPWKDAVLAFFAFEEVG